MKYLLILFLLPLKLFSQDVTGVWIGSIYNDTTQTSPYYEVAIGEDKGKYTAYSYTTFILNGQPYTGLKSVKVVKVKDGFFFEDIDLLSHNYPIPPPKGVKQLSSVALSETDTTTVLKGKFITTRTRQYGRQVTGTVRLERKKDVPNTKLIAQLDKLGLSNTLSFLWLKNSTTLTAVTTQPKPSPLVGLKDEVNNPEKPLAAVTPKKPADPLEQLTKRKLETIETVYFTSDSLRLELYDNGSVDGDSVSIIVNGKILLQHQRLTETAIKKTLHVTPDITDTLNIIMYAENLGTISPNSGLMIIYDGSKRHEIRFSGDLQKNALVVLKRRK